MMEVRVYSYCKLVCISIHTQKMLLEKYCKDNGYQIYDYYIDDGYHNGIYFNEKGVRYIAVNDNIHIMNSTLLNILILLQP